MLLFHLESIQKRKTATAFDYISCDSDAGKFFKNIIWVNRQTCHLSTEEYLLAISNQNANFIRDSYYEN